MSSSENEHDDNVFDQLKSIKPFTVDQLYLLHPDVGCPPRETNHITNSTQSGDQDLYQNLLEYEQLRHKLTGLRSQLKTLHRKTFDHVEQIWSFNEESVRKIGMCQQGKIAETTFKFRQASLNQKQLDAFSDSCSQLSEMISKEYTYYSFESQVKRQKIATYLASAYQINDVEERVVKLKATIATLIDFVRQLGESKSDFVLNCRRWLRSLMKRLLERGTTDDYCFVIAQLCRGPPGIAEWSSDLVECKPFDQVSGFDSIPQYITHCSTLLTELFNNLSLRIRKVTASADDLSPTNDCPDQNWSLVDPRFSCSEELNLSSNTGNTLSENDVILFCLRNQVAQIFREYVKKCLQSEEFEPEIEKNYELIMLRLLTIGTIIIKTYQTGLEAFNSIQYGNLIEYLSSQIRNTVIVLSDQWSEFKQRLKGIDNALMMRLQVEYDNFILRSILIILELRERGIWRHLAQNEPDANQESGEASGWSADNLGPAFAKLLQVTGLAIPVASSSPSTVVETTQQIASRRSSNSLTHEFSIEWFKEVSEPMLWHILWQFYHSAFGGSCEYNSENFWIEKFREKSVVYLFVNKMKDSSYSECAYLMNSMTNILLSRTKHDSKLMNFIASEIFNLSFKQSALRDKVTKKGITSLSRCAAKFPNLISLYISSMLDDNLNEDIVELFKKCSLSGWLCNEDEFGVIARWLVEYPLKSPENMVARLIISKLVLNSPEHKTSSSTNVDAQSKGMIKTQRFLDLKLRRHLALLLYEASIHHLPENNDYSAQSLGAFVELELGGLFCERSAMSQNNLIELATDTSYQKLYVWIWRLLFTFKLHILNQQETDWNDVRSRSGTSRSTKNTVLFNDSFHPAPSLQDSECLSLSEGVNKQNSLALFIYLVMTDVTWQTEALDSCWNHLNLLAISGHLTPSLMIMSFLTICHLNDLASNKEKNYKDYFSTIINSNFDSTRIASLIVCQMQSLKQFRQLQLSQFYVTALLETASIVGKQLSSSWFFADEYKLEKIANLLDYIAKFNFTTQRLEIIRIFYDCSYSSLDSATPTGWFGSLFSTNSSSTQTTKKEFLTTLHVLSQKYKNYTWLRWITAECDSLSLENIWRDIVACPTFNEGFTLDSAIKKVCPQMNPTVLKSILPIYSWIDLIFDIVESDLNHPLCPLLWYNFFLNYFANPLNGVSIGLKLVPQEILNKLMSRLDSLFNYHLYKHRIWTSASSFQQNSLTKLYKAYRLWLQDISLLDAYVDIDRLREEYLVPLLKAVMDSSTDGACLQYIDIQSIEMQNRNLSQVWSTAMQLEGNKLLKDMIFVDSDVDSMQILTNLDDEASDAATLISQQQKPQPEVIKTFSSADDELKLLVLESYESTYRTLDEVIDLVKKSFQDIFEESSVFDASLTDLDRSRLDVTELVKELYTNKKREIVRIIPCSDGLECAGPARITFDIEEATLDERKSQFILDRQQHFEEILCELLLLPTAKVVQSTIIIEDNVRKVICDPIRVKPFIQTLMVWISESDKYDQLNGSYHPANHSLKSILEIFASSEEADAFNSNLIEMCFQHPGSVQILSPHLSPSVCSPECFLDLYQKVSKAHERLGPMAMFVLLSKFDLNSWLRKEGSSERHESVIYTTCIALKHLGKQPDESFILTFDLYRRHIQIELAPPDRRRYALISLVIRHLLEYMDQQSISPILWADFMSILGLDKRTSALEARTDTQHLNKSVHNQSKDRISLNESIIRLNTSNNEESTVINMLEDVAKFADCQMILDYHSLQDMIKIISDFVKEKHDATDLTLLEVYQDYLEQFSIVMSSVTFMWIRTMGENYPDNHELIWNQFIAVWYHWIFLTRNCQNVGKSSYSLIVDQFVSALLYMIDKISRNTQSILRSVLKILANHVQSTKEVIYLELTILQRSLKVLPWSSLIATSEDFENLTILSEQENYNVSDLISHILQQINIQLSLSKINEADPEALPHVAEKLATTIVLQSNHLKGFRLQACYFTLIPTDSIEKIASLVLPRMEFANLEHSQNNKLLVNLLRFMCIKLDLGELNGFHIEDSFDRSIIYARFISNYLTNLITNHQHVVKHHKSYISAVINNSIEDLKILLWPDVDIAKKTTLLKSLLGCCNNSAMSTESCSIIIRSLVESPLLKDRPIVVMEVFHAVGQILEQEKVLVYAVEQLIDLYLNMNGHYEKVWKSFYLKAVTGEQYLNACVEENTALALLVYFEVLFRNGHDEQAIDTSDLNESQTSSNSIWLNFFYWTSKISITPMDGSKPNELQMITLWLRMLEMLDHDFQKSIYPELPSDKQIDKTKPNDVPINGDAATRSQPSASPSNNHEALINYIKYLIALYDSNNPNRLWFYLRPASSEQKVRISLVAVSIACFLADRVFTYLKKQTKSGEIDDSRPVKQDPHLNSIREDLSKCRKVCISKLEAAKKSKYHLEHAQFIETLLESVDQNDKVQYSEGVQLITTFVKSTYQFYELEDDYICLTKILQTLSE